MIDVLVPATAGVVTAALVGAAYYEQRQHRPHDSYLGVEIRYNGVEPWRDFRNVIDACAAVIDDDHAVWLALRGLRVWVYPPGTVLYSPRAPSGYDTDARKVRAALTESMSYFPPRRHPTILVENVHFHTPTPGHASEFIHCFMTELVPARLGQRYPLEHLAMAYKASHFARR